ncbi:flagellar basal body L-ring protein FlgH [Methanolacinia paynteri]|uniref:hypothetical protein n=1 Tax=Methanolacinia paynteri TaxID=230356 RepID=UPI0012F6B41E|nr:hypothetical protein [Methanolacinia paynteri]
MNSKLISTLIIVTAIFCIMCPAQAEGQITVTALGDGSYFFDEVIKLSGTNTASDNVYLFITGPNLNQNGEKPDEFGMAAITGDENTFIKTPTDVDGTWEYTLDAGGLSLSYGTYTIYAVTEPDNKGDLSGGMFDTVTIVLKKKETATKVNVETKTAKNGNITIAASGDGKFYEGELITFTGTNSESDYVYLFVCGDALDANGDKFDDPGTAAVTGKENTFVKVAADSHDTWEYELDTTELDLDPGTYTVYAVTEPANKEDLSGGSFDTVPIVLKKPYISAQVSEPVIKRGEELTITGTAEGMPKAIAIWVLGFSYWNGAENGSMVKIVPEDDASYKYVLDGDETAKMDDGEYYVIVQHPMYDDEFGVITNLGDGGKVLVSPEAGQGFYIWGTDSRLRGTDAVEELISEIASADTDDAYARCTFEVKGQADGTPETTRSGNAEEQKSRSNTENSIFSSIGEFFAGMFGSN